MYIYMCVCMCVVVEKNGALSFICMNDWKTLGGGIDMAS